MKREKERGSLCESKFNKENTRKVDSRLVVCEREDFSLTYIKEKQEKSRKIGRERRGTGNSEESCAKVLPQKRKSRTKTILPGVFYKQRKRLSKFSLILSPFVIVRELNYQGQY